jgi:hypothetical protein
MVVERMDHLIKRAVGKVTKPLTAAYGPRRFPGPSGESSVSLKTPLARDLTC